MGGGDKRKKHAFLKKDNLEFRTYGTELQFRCQQKTVFALLMFSHQIGVLLEFVVEHQWEQLRSV